MSDVNMNELEFDLESMQTEEKIRMLNNVGEDYWHTSNYMNINFDYVWRMWICLNWFVCCISWVIGYLSIVIHTFKTHQVLFHPLIVGFYFGWEILHCTKKYGTSTFSSFWLRLFSIMWASLDSMTVFKLLKYGYIHSNYSLIFDQIMFAIGFVCIIISAYYEGPPNKNVKYSSIPVTAVCMIQLCFDALTLECCSNDYMFIAWGIGIGNITGAIATWHKIPWNIWGKLSWILVSIFSILYIIIITLNTGNNKISNQAAES